MLWFCSDILPTDLEESEHNRRSGFVDSLLRDAHQPMVSLDASLEFEKSLDACNVKQADGNSYPESTSLDRTGIYLIIWKGSVVFPHCDQEEHDWSRKLSKVYLWAVEHVTILQQ